MNQQLITAFVDELHKIAMVAPGTLRAGARLRGPIGEMVRGWMGVGESGAGALGGSVKQRLKMVKEMSPDTFRTFVGKRMQAGPATVAIGKPARPIRHVTSKPKWTISAEQMRAGMTPQQAQLAAV
jgi:hypothetical protein